MLMTPAYPTLLLFQQVSAWEEPPKKQLALKPTDLTARLNKKWLQLYWPDDGKWWPCQVATVDVRKKTVTLIYETGQYFQDSTTNRLHHIELIQVTNSMFL